uniref:Acyl-CoA thioesterase 8 n=1 Tax=Dromaius novaehollandiae TaxID=8790 RepID=A0A8C4JH30_DRONO
RGGSEAPSRSSVQSAAISAPRLSTQLGDPNLAEKYRKLLNKIQAKDVPIDIKPVNPPDVFCSEPQEPKHLFWVRARGYIGECDMKVHCCVAAYISDYSFLGTALLPHRQYDVKFMVSLDHSMWFHAPFRADHWMLYECESPWAGESSPRSPGAPGAGQATPAHVERRRAAV